MSFQDTFAASRRLFLLQLLAKVNGSANGSVLWTEVSRAFLQASRADLAADLDHLAATGCTRDEWLDDQRLVILTDRGEDAAHGRVEVAGVERPRSIE